MGKILFCIYTHFYNLLTVRYIDIKYYIQRREKSFLHSNIPYIILYACNHIFLYVCVKDIFVCIFIFMNIFLKTTQHNVHIVDEREKC